LRPYRHLKIIPNAFGERAVLKLMFGALKLREFEGGKLQPNNPWNIRHAAGRYEARQAARD
jgi:hypothetical protein